MAGALFACGREHAPSNDTGRASDASPGAASSVGTSDASPLDTLDARSLDGGALEPTDAGAIDAASTLDASLTASFDAAASDASMTDNNVWTGEEDCTLEVEARLGGIATVGVITFKTHLHTIDAARIEFGPKGEPLDAVAPVDLTAPNHKTLLLGLKQARDYAFRVVVQSGERTCVSEERTLATGSLPEATSNVVKQKGGGTPGFIVSSTCFLGSPGDAVGEAFIVDTDGERVWSAPGSARASRARIDWEAKNMWYMALNEANQGGRIDRLALDGESSEVNIPELSRAHHDLTVMPNGHVAVLSWLPPDRTPAGGERCTEILDYDPATGAARPIVEDVSTLYTPVGECHTNAITYQRETNTLIVSDVFANLFVKLSASDGTPIWQLGGSNPLAEALHVGEMVWSGNHGHHLTPSGRFVFFNNFGLDDGNESAVQDLQLDEGERSVQVGTMLSDGSYSGVLGDVQVLSNGNLWVTYSMTGLAREYDTTGAVVAEYTGLTGYSYFMESLYEPPNK